MGIQQVLGFGGEVEGSVNYLFGYYDRYSEEIRETTTDGAITGSGSVVPAGEVWVVTSLAVRHNDPAARALGLFLHDGTSSRMISYQAGVAQWVTLDKQGWWVLKEGDSIRGTAYALAANKRVELYILGFKMKVA